MWYPPPQADLKIPLVTIRPTKYSDPPMSGSLGASTLRRTPAAPTLPVPGSSPCPWARESQVNPFVTYRPLEPRDFKGSFKVDIGPHKKYMRLCWPYIGLLSPYKP